MNFPSFLLDLASNSARRLRMSVYISMSVCYREISTIPVPHKVLGPWGVFSSTDTLGMLSVLYLTGHVGLMHWQKTIYPFILYFREYSCQKGT